MKLMALAVAPIAIGLMGWIVPGVVLAGQSDSSVRDLLQAACRVDDGSTYQILPGTFEPYDLTYGCLGDSERFAWLGTSRTTSTFVDACDNLGFDAAISGGGVVLPFPIFVECRQDTN